MLVNKLPWKTKQKPSRKRVGRGIAAGGGKTAGRGTKGQAARSGYRRKPAFEGGQTPLIARLPKLKGFKSRRQPVQEITPSTLNRLDKKTVNPRILAEAGIIKKANHPVKLINDGQAVKKTMVVSVHATSKSARQAVEKAGGQVQIISMPQARPNRRPPVKEKQ